MEMRKKNWLTYLLIPALVVAISCKKDDENDNNNNNNGNSNKKNESVIKQIGASNLAEITLGQLAGNNGGDTLVKAFGAMMVTDHQKAQDELDSMAGGRNIDLPVNLDTVNSALRDSLTALSGFDFDTSYIKSQILAHTKVKNMFEAIKDSTNDAQLKSYVTKYLPDINQHLAKADSIASVLGVDTTGMGNDTTGVGNDTTGVGNDTTGVGNDTTGVGNDTTGVGNDTTGTGNDTSNVGTDSSVMNMYIRRR
jgi:putative membrane protein